MDFVLFAGLIFLTALFTTAWTDHRLRRENQELRAELLQWRKWATYDQRCFEKLMDEAFELEIELKRLRGEYDGS